VRWSPDEVAGAAAPSPTSAPRPYRCTPAASRSTGWPCATRRTGARQRTAPRSDDSHHAGQSSRPGQRGFLHPAPAVVAALPALRMRRPWPMLTSSWLMLRVCASPATVPALSSSGCNLNNRARANPASALSLCASSRNQPSSCSPAARLSSPCLAPSALQCSSSMMTSVLLFYPPSLIRRAWTSSSSDRRHSACMRYSSRGCPDLANSLTD